MAPRFDSVEVFPSAAAGLVTRMTPRSRSCRANCSDVRSDRYASAAGDIGLASDTTSGLLRFFHEFTIGTAAITVAPPNSSAISLEFTASSRLSRRNAAARPRIRPAARPSKPFLVGLGELGDSGVWAGVTRTRPPTVPVLL